MRHASRSLQPASRLLRPPSRRLGAPARLAPLIVLALLAGSSVVGCADHADGDLAFDPQPTAVATPMATPSHATMDGGGGTFVPVSPDEATSLWASRPSFVDASGPGGAEAYAFAMERPDVLDWLPCYCGCGGMGHRSNLDCFLKRRTAAGPAAFEEHGSYCGVCVETALMAKEMAGAGRSLVEIRAAVDASFGDLAPGTPTELPSG